MQKLRRVLHSAIVLSTCLFAMSIPGFAAVEEPEAREIAANYLRSTYGWSDSKFVNTQRREDLEDDLFALQSYVEGEIHEAAFFFEASTDGHEIVSTSEVIIHATSDATDLWIIAVTSDDGTPLGLFGFEDGEENFNKLAQAARLRIRTSGRAESIRGLFLRAVWFGSQGQVLTRERDLRRRAEDYEEYRKSRYPGFSTETWLRRLKESGVEPDYKPALAETDEGFTGALDLIAWNGGENEDQLILRRAEFLIGKDGTIEVLALDDIFPK